MVELIDSAMSLVTEQMVRGWVRYGCYKIPGDDTPLDKERCIEKSLELKKPPNFMDMALRIWKDTTLKNTHSYKIANYSQMVNFDQKS